MRRLTSILSAFGLVAVILAIFVMTQIADSQGRTLLDRVPVVGSPLGAGVRLLGIADPQGSEPIIQTVDLDRALMEGTSCSDYLAGDQTLRLRVSAAFAKLLAREGDQRAQAADQNQLAAALGSLCQRSDGSQSVDHAIRSLPTGSAP